METADIVLWVVVGAVMGIGLFYIVLKMAANILMRRLAQDIKELEAVLEQTERSIPARVELHNNVFFVYNNNTNEFMAQGNSITELRERIKARWGQNRVSVVAGDDQALKLLEQQINENSSS
jgi:predicted RNase H-like HicB family nuclease